MCLDVDLKASFSTANYPLVAANEAQFARAGSYAEIADYDQANDAGLVVVAIDGKTAIDSLIVKEGEGTALTDLKGKTIGVKGKLPPSIKAMLAKAGMVEGKDYTTVGIEGFDPLVHIQLPGLAGFPGYKSNEPGTLERAGISFTLFDPSKDGIPGSFGVIYTNAGFLTEHPTAAQDFVRASMRGMEDALADPKAAAQAAVDLINANGNKNFLSPEGEQFRWTTESGLVTQFTPKGQPVGLIDPADLQSQIDAYDAVAHLHRADDRGTTTPRSSPASTARTGVVWPPGERRYANGLDARRTARKSATSNPGTWAAATLSSQLKRTVSGCARTSSTSRRVNALGKSCRGHSSSTARTASVGNTSAPTPRTSTLMPRLAILVSGLLCWAMALVA
jgi:NitT/TauT family transport system substrate-binding protein